MPDLEDLPTELAICSLSPSGDKTIPKWVMQKPVCDKSRMHPNVPLEKSPLWVSLKEMHTGNMSDTWCRERIAPLAKALQAAMKREDTAEGVPISIIKEHGVLAWHALRRMWDLHLAYNGEKRIGGIEKIIPKGDRFDEALKNASFQFFYITLFKDQLGRALSQWKEEEEEHRGQSKCRFSAEMAEKNYRDMIIRVEREHRMVGFLEESAAKGSFEVLHTKSKMGDDILTNAGCNTVAQVFWKANNPGKEVDKKACSKNGDAIRGMVARIVDSWKDISPTEQPTVEVVAKEILLGMLRDIGAYEVYKQLLQEREQRVKTGGSSS